MKMKSLALAMAAIGLGMAAQAYAFSITSGGIPVSNEGEYSSVPGAVTTNFNDGALPANYAGGSVVIGSVSGSWASPPADTSRYYSVGPSSSTPGTVTFSQPLQYFGFYWGSPDTYNVLELWNGGSLVQSFDGTYMASTASLIANGSWAAGAYLNVAADNASEYFDTIVFRSSINAFETDNHAILTAVPEPETYAMLIAGLGLMGFIARRRKQRLL